MSKHAQIAGGDIAESFPAVPGSVPTARRLVVALAQEAGAGERELEAIRLATSEALTNAVVHAYAGEPGLIHVHAELDDEGLSVAVADDGRGLAPRVDRRGMGLGLALIAQAAEHLAISKRAGGGTVVQMRFALSRRS